MYSGVLWLKEKGDIKCLVSDGISTLQKGYGNFYSDGEAGS